jgi:predicted O-methyltransferase YrrM
VVTIEGCPETAAAARANFKAFGASNIMACTGNFDEVLQPLLHQHASPAPRLFFFDGNHRKVPTLHYFEQCLSCAGNDDVFVFDDIRWSDEMLAAWEAVASHPRVTVTLDLFFMGIVFIRKEQARERFRIRF